MSECLFCKILNNEIPSNRVYEDDYVYAFEDINPLAKEHYLFISKNHSENFNDLSSDDLVHIHQAIKKFTSGTKLETDGYRVVTNINSFGGQTVFHTHFHVLGGEQLKGFGV